MSRVTMEDIAREAGVSRALVSLAYRGAVGVSQSTRNHILAIGESLDYTPNRLAARLAGSGGNSLGIFLQDLHNDVFAEVYDGIREVSELDGLHLVLTVGTIDGTRDVASLDALTQSRVDVIIAAGLQLPDPDVIATNRRSPIISVARAVPGVDSVVSDNIVGARLATEHLIELGHRKIIFLANPPTDGYLDRRLGYEKAMKDAGLTARVVPTTYARTDAAVDAGRLLDGLELPTAVFAHNDQAALGVLDALTLRGLSAGRDVSVVGYDNTSISRAPGTGLTTIDVHSRSLGRNAAQLALRRLSDPGCASELRASQPSLLVRSTTGPPANA